MKRWEDEVPVRGSTPRSHRWSYVALSAMLLLGLALAVTLPKAEPTDLRVEVSCVSGAPVVGVWIEAERGASGWADLDGDAYQFRLKFGGRYQVNVGCGGTANDWGIGAESTSKADVHRRLRCDDVTAGPPFPCHDVRT